MAEFYAGRNVVGEDLSLIGSVITVPPCIPLYNALLSELLNFFPCVAGQGSQHILGVLAL
jgi:hypothetical protein